jgi:hypothetical protein
MKTKRLECVLCGTISVIQRKDSKDRPAGHIKHMYCPRCQARRPHKELDEFVTEFHKNIDEFEAVRQVMTKCLAADYQAQPAKERRETCDTQEVMLSNRAGEQPDSKDSI